MKPCKMLTPPIKASIISFCTLAAAILSSFAGTPKEFSGATKGDWFEPSNWTPAGVPTADDDVTISAKTVTAIGDVVAGSIALTDAATLNIGNPAERTTVRNDPPDRPNVSATISGDLTLTGASKLLVFAGTLADTNDFHEAYLRGEAYTNAMAAVWAGKNVVSIGGVFSVDGNSTVTPDNEPITGTPVAFVCKEFFLGEGSTVTTVKHGWDWSNGLIENAPAGTHFLYEEGSTPQPECWTWAFGAGFKYGAGGGYGGNGQGVPTVDGKVRGLKYGYSFAPFLSGSPTGGYRPHQNGTDDSRGSGSFVVYASDALTVNGTITADALDSQDYSGASGGGIWLATGAEEVTFGANARLTANGATGTYRGNAALAYSANGGGGRIAVAQGIDSGVWNQLAAGVIPSGYVESATIVGVATSVDPAANGKEGKPLPEAGTCSFVQNAQAKVGLQIVFAGVGSVDVNGTTYDSDSTVKVMPGSVLTLTAVDKDESLFTSWIGAVVPGGRSTEKSITVTVNEQTSVFVNFASTIPAARAWTGAAGDRDFLNGFNWSPTGVPGANDDLTIAGVTLGISLPSGETVCRSLTLEANTVLAVGDEAKHATDVGLRTTGDLVVRGGAKLTVSAPELADLSIFATCESDYTTLYPVLWNAAKVVTVGGDFVVSNKATVVSDAAPMTGVPVVFKVAGDFRVGEGATVSGKNRGWCWQGTDVSEAPAGYKPRRGNGQLKTFGWTLAPGAGLDYGPGGGYGGRGLTSDDSVIFAGHTYAGSYGLAIAPFLPGSPAGWYRAGDVGQSVTVTAETTRGGGQVTVFAGGAMRIDGTVDASASNYDYTGASGGGIWLGAASFEFGENAKLLAIGGDTAIYNSAYNPGAGGRIALAEGMDDAAIASCVAGTMPAGHTDWGVIDMVSISVVCGIQQNLKQRVQATDGTVAYLRPTTVPIPVEVTIDGHGAVMVGGETFETNFTYMAACGEELTLTAQPAADARFLSWNGETIPGGSQLGRTLVTIPLRPVAFTVSMPAGVQTRTWTGASSAYLDDIMNWSPAGEMSANDALVLPSGASATATNSFEAYTITLQGTARLTVTAVPTEGLCDAASLYGAATVVKARGGLFVDDTATLQPVCDEKSGTAVRFEVGDFRLAADAKVDAKGKGWFWFEGEDTRSVATQDVYQTIAPGAGRSYDVSAGHGGRGGRETSASAAPGGEPYGNALAPFLPGSPNGIYNKTLSNAGHGGGVVWIDCSGTATLNGRIDADGTFGSIYGSASGGGVWLTTKNVSVGRDAILTAEGGGRIEHKYYSAGAGGRIALGIGLTAGEIAALAAGEAPAGATVEESISIVSASVLGGETLVLPKGSDEHYRAPSGTLATVCGSSRGAVVRVTTDGVRVLGLAPGYGAWTVGTATEFTAPEYGIDSDDASVRYACTGYALTDASGTVISAGPGRSVTVNGTEGPCVLTWKWAAVAESRVVILKPAHATLKVGGEAVEGFDRFVADGTSLAVEIVPDDGYQFLGWTMDAPWRHEFDAAFTLTVKGPQTFGALLRTYAAPATRTWTPTGGGYWTWASNWDPAGVPGPEDTLVVNQGVCYLTNAIAVGALTVNGGTFGLSEGVTTAGAAICRVSGDVNVTGGSLLLGRNGTQSHHRLSVGGDLKLTGGALMAYGGPVEGDFSYATGTSFIEVEGTFSVAAGAAFQLLSEPHDGGSVKVTAGTFALAEGATVDATGLGYGWLDNKTPPVNKRCGNDFNVGGGHAAKGENQGSDVDDRFGRPYGQRLAPVEPGAANGCYQGNKDNVQRGGGLVRIHAKTMLIAGAIRADAGEKSMATYFGGAAGGGIWLTADAFDFAATASLSVHGGKSGSGTVNYTSVGSGGRIAIGLNLPDEALLSLAETGRCAGVGDPDRRRNARSIAAFKAAFPAFDVENNLDLKSGVHVKDGTFVDASTGTFDFYTPKGVLLIVR